MSRDLVIGLDVGTTACKALAVSREGRVEASAAGEYPLHTPQPGFAEQDVHEIWQGVCGALRALCAKIEVGRLAGIALSGAMHSLLPVDGSGNPLARAMTWADLRAVDAAGELRRDDPRGQQYLVTGCPHQWLYHPAKLRWMRRHQPQLLAEASRFVAIKDWLLHRLTGTWATDIGMASASGLLDLTTRHWNADALARAEIDTSRLPPLREPHDRVGEVTAAAAEATALPAHLPVMPGGGDGGMANIGAGAATSGRAVITVGTSGAVRITAARPVLDPSQRTWCYVLNNELFYAGGAINNGGIVVDAVRRLHYGDLEKGQAFARLFADAQDVSPGADGVLCLPYFAGERSPHWRADLTGALSGLTHAHHRGHVARAVLEGVAFCLADVWGALCESLPSPPDAIRLTGGITRSPVWSRIICDVLGVPVTLNEAGDASALGAAAVAQLGAGHIASLADFPIDVADAVHLAPNENLRAIYAECHGYFQEAGQAMMRAI
jgi:gluconokinase